MSANTPFDFEPVVELPDNAFDAARIYLGVLAYPERGAGQPGGLGVPFGAALWQYLVWNARKAKGLRYVRERFGDHDFRPPARRDFEGALTRGRNRLRRRSAAYSLTGTQMLRGFLGAQRKAKSLLAEGREAEVFAGLPDAAYRPFRPELWTDVASTPRRTIKSDVDRWARRLALNETATSDRDRKAKDLVRRAYLESRPVLHMAHGFNMIVQDIAPKLGGWGDWDWLLVLLWNPEAWVWEATRHAHIWRRLSFRRYAPGLDASDMIELVAPGKYAG